MLNIFNLDLFCTNAYTSDLRFKNVTKYLIKTKQYQNIIQESKHPLGCSYYTSILSTQFTFLSSDKRQRGRSQCITPEWGYLSDRNASAGIINVVKSRSDEQQPGQS